jgi:hypothetical protein
MKSEDLIKEAKICRQEADKLERKAIKQISPGQCRQAANKIASRKGSVAVFLGAGASKAFGWPLTKELLPEILIGLIDNDLFDEERINTAKEDQNDRELLKKVTKGLCPGLQIEANYVNRNREKLPLVTSLLSMIDFSLATGQSLIDGITPDHIRHARQLLERAIYEIVAHELKKNRPNNWPPRKINKLAKKLGGWLDGIREGKKYTGIITSNYDPAVEQIWRLQEVDLSVIKSRAIDFGFPWLWASNGDEEVISRPTGPLRRLYKLHGSTNWLRCGLCDRIYVNLKADIAFHAFNRKVDTNNKCHCGHSKLEMQIVSPSFVRDIRSANLISVWQSALDWLREAEDWIIIGYSFPDEDLNIRSLFARALASGKNEANITIIQYGADEQIRMRYEAFFPNKRLTYLTGGLETFIENID